MSEAEIKEHQVWDRVVRWFHWINLTAILGLAGIGTVIFFGKDLGLSNDGKIILKTIHVLIGYLFVANLLVRLGWAFIGSEHARWPSLIPAGPGFARQMADQIRNFSNQRGHAYVGHSPLGKISILLMLVCLIAMATTGLVLAGTDVYYPPLGNWIAEWIAAPGVAPESLIPYQPDMLNAAAYEEMRAFRSPFKMIHEYTFFALLGLVPLHIAGVVFAEVKGGGGLISAMVTGRKVIEVAKDEAQT